MLRDLVSTVSDGGGGGRNSVMSGEKGARMMGSSNGSRGCGRTRSMSGTVVMEYSSHSESVGVPGRYA